MFPPGGGYGDNSLSKRPTVVGPMGQQRRPLTVMLLRLIPFYTLFWVHRMKKEIRGHTGDEPATVCSTCVMCIPIANLVAWFKLGREISEMQRKTGLRNIVSGRAQFASNCLTCTSLNPFVYQGALNSYWEFARARGLGRPPP